MSDERRPVDLADEVVGVSGEAADLAEHIRDMGPAYTRRQQFDLLIEMIDDAHELALETSVRLDDE